MCVFRQGCALHLQRLQAKATATAKAGIPWFGGATWTGRTRRKPIHGGSMAASMPPTVLPAHAAPPLTDFRDLMDPRHAWMNLHRNRIFRIELEKHPRMAWIYCVDQGRHLPTAVHAVPTDRGNLSKAGWVRLRGREPHGCGDRAYMDVLAAPPATGPTSPSLRKPAFASALAVAVASAGAGRSPAKPLPPGHCLPPLGQQLRPAQALAPPAQRGAVLAGAPGQPEGFFRLVLLHLTDHQLAARDRGARARLGQETEAHAFALQFQLAGHVRHRQHLLPHQQADRAWQQPARRIGDGDRAVLDQLLAPEHARYCSQWMFGCDREHELHRAQRLDHVTTAAGALARRADQQVGTAVQQSLPGAGQGLADQPQPGRCLGLTKRGDVRAEQPGRKHRVHRQRQLGLPARRHPAHPQFQLAGRAQQVTALVQQGAASVGRLGARANPVEQLHAQILLQLGNGVGNGRGHLVQSLAGAGKGAAAVDGIQDLQGIEAELEHSNFSMMAVKTIRFSNPGRKRILLSNGETQRLPARPAPSKPSNKEIPSCCRSARALPVAWPSMAGCPRAIPSPSPTTTTRATSASARCG
ncbi:hypothetical protein SMJ63A_50268 [Stenotrophomonas geniculata]